MKQQRKIYHGGDINHPEFPHGQLRGFKAGCRCLDCKRARADYNLKQKGVKKPRYRKLLGIKPDHPEFPHGTITGYRYCKCDLCKKANADAKYTTNKARMERSKAARNKKKECDDAYRRSEQGKSVRRESHARRKAKMSMKLPYAVPFRKTIKAIYDHCPEGYHVDHIIPLSKGGVHHPNNLQYLPASVNIVKRNNLFFDYSDHAIRWQHLIEPSTTIPEGSTAKRPEAPSIQIMDDDIVSSLPKGKAARKGGQGFATLGEDIWSRKRTVHKLREKAKFNESKWWAQVWDQLLFMYGSGSRGVNGEYQFSSSYSGFANNSFSSPDSEHIFYAGGTTKATLTSSNTMTLTDLEKILAGAKMMNNIRSTAGTDGSTKTPKIHPIQVKVGKEDGDVVEHYVLLMNPWQAYNLRVSAGTNNWMDYQKAAAGAEGKMSKIFKGGLGLINGVVLQEHDAIVRFSDYGSGSNLNAARALFLGAQAMVVAWGSPGNGMRLGWHEETRDNGNQSVIATSAIFGVNKVTYNGKDFGVYALDTYAADPRS